MIFRLFRGFPENANIAALYGAIVAQARAAAFYQNYAVPDTVEGRFEMILLHLVLLLRRLGSEPESVRRTGQALFDHFCEDMDANLREMGVGDLAVPRRMRAVGEAFYGRKAVYEAALDAGGEGLALAIGRNIYGVTSPPPEAERLAAYVRRLVDALAAQDGLALSRATIQFPQPEPAGMANPVPESSV